MGTHWQIKGIPHQNYGQIWANEGHSRQNYGHTSADKGHSTSKLREDMGKRGHSRQNYGHTLANKGHSTSKLRADMGKWRAFTSKLWAHIGRQRAFHVKITRKRRSGPSEPCNIYKKPTGETKESFIFQSPNTTSAQFYAPFKYDISRCVMAGAALSVVISDSGQNTVWCVI